MLTFLRVDESEEGREREANIQELMSALQEFEEVWRVEDSPPMEAPETKRKLNDFLERVSLVTDTDDLDQKKQDQVTLMTLHAAKGLEFKVCFMVGLEEALFPSARSYDSFDEMEEERRLCYVGMTRAREILFLTRALRRRTFGSFNSNLASRFLKDIPSEIIETTVDHAEDYGHWDTVSKPQKEGREDFDFEFDQRVRSSTFKRGQRVKHPSFGEGVVQKVEYLGEDECLTIRFEAKGTKKVLSQFIQA